MNRERSSRVLAGCVMLLALVLAVGCSKTEQTPAASTPATMQADVDSLFQNYVDALNRSDSTAASECFGPQGHVTVAGREQFFHSASVARSAGESPFAMGQNTFDVDTVEVIPVENAHALALVVYTVDPSDQDVPAFHTTGTYLLEKMGAKWRIVHAHVCPAREM